MAASSAQIAYPNYNSMTLTPAYGRDYKSKAAVLTDFNNNKDFILQPEEKPINKEQIPQGTLLQFRYGKLRKTFAIFFTV